MFLLKDFQLLTSLSTSGQSLFSLRSTTSTSCGLLTRVNLPFAFTLGGDGIHKLLRVATKYDTLLTLVNLMAVVPTQQPAHNENEHASCELKLELKGYTNKVRTKKNVC